MDCPSCGKKMSMDKVGLHCSKCMKTIKCWRPWQYTEAEIKRYFLK